MEWKFEKTQDIMRFADHISSELVKQGKHELVSEINQFSNTSFTTSSEFLGEFRMLMSKILLLKEIKLDKETESAIFKAIETISKAFGNRI